MSPGRQPPAAPADAPLREGLRLTARALREAPGGFTIGGLGAAVYAAMVVASAVVLGRITDRLLIPAFRSGRVPAGVLGVAAAAILGVSVIKAGGIFARRYGAYRARYRLEADYRNRVVRRYLSLPLTWHRRHATGELLANANDDVQAAWFIAAPLPMAFGATLLVIGTTVMLVLTDPYLTAVGLLIAPAVGAANFVYQRRQREAARLAQQGRADVAELAHESFDAALTVKALGLEDAETTRFRAVAEELRDRVVEVVRLRAIFSPLVEALPKLGILAVLLVGAWRVRAGLLTAGEMVQFGFLFQLLGLPMRVFGWMLGDLPRALAGWERLNNVLEADDEMDYGAAAAAGDGGAPIALEDVDYRHPPTRRESLSGDRAGDEPAGDEQVGDEPVGDEPERAGGVRGVSFDVEPGSTVAIVGPTGAGKSTIAGLMVRLFDPDSGRVRYDGRRLQELDRDALAAGVAVVFQDPFLFADSVRGNITLGEDFSDRQVAAAAELAGAAGFIGELEQGYDTVIGERGAGLSGGQRQRIALARAVIRRPRLLVLDDATSAVDPAVEAGILDRLVDLEATVVNVAYRRSAITVADRVVFVREGTVVAQGAHRELLAAEPDYAALLSGWDDVVRPSAVERSP